MTPSAAKPSVAPSGRSPSKGHAKAMEKNGWKVCSWLTRSEGVTVWRSSTSRICACSSVSPLVTDTEIGVS